jgi:hypothetical protein
MTDNDKHKIRLANKDLKNASPLIKWYVEYLLEEINTKNGTIDDYEQFFKTMKKFLPSEG